MRLSLDIHSIVFYKRLNEYKTNCCIFAYVPCSLVTTTTTKKMTIDNIVFTHGSQAAVVLFVYTDTHEPTEEKDPAEWHVREREAKPIK